MNARVGGSSSHGVPGSSRRRFLTTVSTAWAAGCLAEAGPLRSGKQGARVRTVFVYPPSKSFAADPDGWWSWPGNEFDAEGRQERYASALREIGAKLHMTIQSAGPPVSTLEDARAFAREIQAERPDGVLLVLFYNRSMEQVDLILKSADESGIPVILFIGLGVKHGTVTSYRRPGIYLIQSLDNFAAIECGMRMINARKLLRQSRLLSITDVRAEAQSAEPYLGIQVRVIPFARYAAEFHQVVLGGAARDLITAFTAGAQELRGVTREALENAARAHFALKKLLADEDAAGVAMNCLRRGMLKPCMSFAVLNGELIPAACENDLPAAYTQMLGQLLTARPGFQHNPCFETERNHYYASHCTCTPKLYGPDGPQLPYLLRRFAHTNEGSCAIQVFWKPGDPVTMMRYYPGQEPALDVYAGKVAMSHPMPPAAGCTTNVEIEITDRDDACMVRGHHNLLFCGEFARKFRLFAQLYKIRLADTGYRGPLPV
jgi:hypothetical protein